MKKTHLFAIMTSLSLVPISVGAITSCSSNPEPVQKFLVTFDLAGDEWIEDLPEKQMYVEKGTTYGKLPKAKKKDGSVFNGWSLNGVTQKDTDKIPDNVTLQATWTSVPVEDYLVKFNLLNDEWIQGLPEKQMYVEPGTTYGQLPIAKKQDGSTFLGWCLGAIVQKTTDIIPGNVTLTPSWDLVPVETCTVIYESGEHCVSSIPHLEIQIPKNTLVSDLDDKWYPDVWQVETGWMFDHWDWGGVTVITETTTATAMYIPHNPSQYFTIHSDQPCSISFVNTEELTVKPDLWYSINSVDSNNWTQYKFEKETISLNEDDILYLKGNNEGGFASDGQIHLTTTKTSDKNPSIALGGSVKGLFAGDGPSALVLPWHALSGFCYNNDFITSVSDTLFSDVTIGQTSIGCMSEMFYGCDGLTKLPKDLLPSSTTSQNCYDSMFENCSNLEEVPVLPATGSLTQDCYKDMFAGDTNLWFLHQPVDYNNHPEDATYFFTAPDEQNEIDFSCSNMFGSETIETKSQWYCSKHVPICLHINYDSTSQDEYLYYTCTYSVAATASLQYKIEDGVWTDWNLNYKIPITSISNKNVYIRNKANVLGTQWCQYSIGFHTDQTVQSQSYAELSGNILSLLNYHDLYDGDEHTFEGLFKCSESYQTIVGYPMLPSKSLNKFCYQNMFQNESNNCPDFLPAYCVPELPAKNITMHCYDHMFAGSNVVNDLNSKRVLPASELPFSCYQSMFEGCKNIKQALYFISPIIPIPAEDPRITILDLDGNGEQCKNMYKNCINLLNPTPCNWKVNSLPFPNDAFAYMFQNCSKLDIRDNSSKSSNSVFLFIGYLIPPQQPFNGIFDGVPNAPFINNGFYYYYEPQE